MARVIRWLALVAVPLGLIATLAMGRMNPSAPAPEVSLGVMKSCAHLGALTKRVALDRKQGIAIDSARYQYYQRYLMSRQTLFRKPDFALLLAYRSDELQPETLKNLGVQTCIAAYYGFRERVHHRALHRRALACQQASRGDDPLQALDDCMGRQYQRLLAEWWQEANEDEAGPATPAAPASDARPAAGTESRHLPRRTPASPAR